MKVNRNNNIEIDSKNNKKGDRKKNEKRYW